MATFFSLQCQILVYVLFMVAVVESFMYYMVYRTERWQKLKAKCVRLTKEVDKKTGEDGTQGKKVKILAKDLRGASVSLYQMKYRWNLAVTVVFAILMWGLSASFKGVPIAALPFTPARMFRFATARGLVDRPNNECSVHFFYMMCCLAIRETAHKALGHGVPRGIRNPVMEASVAMSKKYEEKWTESLTGASSKTS